MKFSQSQSATRSGPSGSVVSRNLRMNTISNNNNNNNNNHNNIIVSNATLMAPIPHVPQTKKEDNIFSSSKSFTSSKVSKPARSPRRSTVFNRLSVRKSTVPSTLLPAKDWQISDFEMGRKLGKGKFGKVYCVREKRSGFICALKVMNKKELMTYKVEKQFVREILLQANVRHINCLRLYNWFEDDQNVYLILEYANDGELYQLLKKERRFGDVRASCYIAQVAKGLLYLHSKNIIHRDLKPENILLHFDNQIKLSDFGWSVYSPGARRTTMCGTLDYLPPEMVEAKNHGKTVDVWALGILMYEFLVGRPPFEEENSKMTYKRIANVDLRIPNYVSPDAADLIKRLLRYDPDKRINLHDVLVHPWILNNKSRWKDLPTTI
ncbi:unnamed protein product [Ambrosiozyma monospora]|uniref:Aurora kinase n=1 Tax=Ambrosiozyma monospora TaxID=43982 RepID=A0A9W6Z6I4_AMBMO|nr:unnamed protein product [Ambrosiozyma monospora]